MSVPNHFDVVARVFSEGTFNLTTKDGCGVFTEQCARALFRIDRNFGHLKKSGGQNQWNGHAVDSVLYRPTGQSIDLIEKSESPEARPSWQEDIPRYSDADWFAPEGGSIDPPPPPPPPPPPQDGSDARLLAVERQLAELTDALRMLTVNVVQRLDRHWVGTIQVKYLGSSPIDLAPTPPLDEGARLRQAVADEVKYLG